MNEDNKDQNNPLPNPGMIQPNQPAQQYNDPPPPPPVETPSIVPASGSVIDPSNLLNNQSSSNKGGGKVGIFTRRKRLMYTILILLLLAGAGAAYYYFYKNEPVATSTVQNQQKKTIEQLNIGVFDTDFKELYPSTKGAGYEADISKQIYEPLVRFKNISSFDKALAKEWKNEDESDTAWTFTLQDGVTFTNGKVLTSDDVKKSIEFAQKDEVLAALTDNIASIETPDVSSVKITTKEPDPLLLNKLTNLLIFDTADTQTSKHANGTGPYTLKEATDDQGETLELTAKTDWYGGEILTKSITIKKYADEAKLTEAMQAKEVDFANIYTDDETVEGLKTWTVPSRSVSFVLFNTKKKAGPAADLNFRKAVSNAVSIDELIKAGSNPDKPLSQYVPIDIPGYNPNIKEAVQNNEEARSYLSKSTYKQGTKVVVAHTGLTAKEAALFKDQLSAVGITVELKEVDTDNFIDDTLELEPDMLFLGYGSDLIDLSDVVSTLFSSSTAIFPWYDNQAVSDRMAEASKEFNSEKRLEILQEISALLDADTAALPFRNSVDVFYVPQDVEFAREYANGNLGVYFWQPYGIE